MENNSLKRQLKDERNNLISIKKVLEEMRDSESILKSYLIKKGVGNEEILNKVEGDKAAVED